MAAAGGAEAEGAEARQAVSALRPRLVALGRRLAVPRGAGGDGEGPRERGDGAGPCLRAAPPPADAVPGPAAPREPARGRGRPAPGQLPGSPPQRARSAQRRAASAGGSGWRPGARGS